MSMHRLIQSTVLHSMTEEQRRTFYNIALEVIGTDHPQSQEAGNTLFASWDVCAVHAPHVLRLQELQTSWHLSAISKSMHFNLFFNSSW
jgi:hypothetical protein